MAQLLKLSRDLCLSLLIVVAIMSFLWGHVLVRQCGCVAICVSLVLECSSEH